MMISDSSEYSIIEFIMHFKTFACAYSFLIGDDGRVYEGAGWHTLGAHTYGYNRNGLGIAFIGNFNGN